MIKKVAAIGLITLSLVLSGCDRRGDDNENPDPEENDTTGRIEKIIEK